MSCITPEEAKLRREIDAKLNDVLGYIQSRLPNGWEIVVRCSNEEASMELEDPWGDEVSTDWDGDSHSVGALCRQAVEIDGAKSKHSDYLDEE